MPHSEPARRDGCICMLAVHIAPPPQYLYECLYIQQTFSTPGNVQSRRHSRNFAAQNFSASWQTSLSLRETDWQQDLEIMASSHKHTHKTPWAADRAGRCRSMMRELLRKLLRALSPLLRVHIGTARRKGRKTMWFGERGTNMCCFGS